MRERTYQLCEIITRLLELGSDVNVQLLSKSTALILASYRESVELVKLLLENNPDMTIINRQGKTALEVAKKQGKGHDYRVYE